MLSEGSDSQGILQDQKYIDERTEGYAELVVGHLYTQGYISAKKDILSLKLDEKKTKL